MSSNQPVGYMPIPVGLGKMFAVQGGPFDAFDADVEGAFGLCLERRSIKEPFATVSLDVPDFSTPKADELDHALAQLVAALYDERPAYIGCMAGRGRTGLAMACLAKSFGILAPVKHVRRWYTPHAVETSGQKAFVESVNLPKTLEVIDWHNRMASRTVVVVPDQAVFVPIDFKAKLKAMKKKLPWLFAWQR